MAFKMKGPSVNISYGGESEKQEKSNLMKDNPVAKHASAMNMNYDTPMELTAEGKKKIMASDANPEFKKAIAKESPANNKGATRNSGDAPKKMSAEDEAKLRAKNKARIAKRKAMIADKKAKGVYGPSSPAQQQKLSKKY